VFYLATALIAFSIFGTLSAEWRSVKFRHYAGEAGAENEEDFARRVHPWSALWTYTSNMFSKLWKILKPIPKQMHTKERTASRGPEMKQSTVQVRKSVFQQLFSP
jgi:hypothetical protein